MDLHYPPYYMDLNQEQQQQKLYDHQILLRSSRLYSNLLEDHQLGYMYMGSQIQPSPYQQEVDDRTIPRGIGGSYDQTTLEITGAKRTNLKFTICKKEDQSSSGSSVKWMPVRIMKKMMRCDEDLKLQPPFPHVGDENRHLMSRTLKPNSENISGNYNNNNGIRVCSDCNTTKTPLWRSGPRGPKSLCNACGIRQRKARRAMSMAMATNSSIPSSVTRAGNGHKKTVNIINNNKAFGAQKKRSKVVKPSRDNHHYDPQRKLWFEEFALKLSKKIPIEQVFPEQEKEAAILLMALSCGFVHG